jgi:hypothetical protein
VETLWSFVPFVDHTLWYNLIQHNWVVLVYNYNLVIGANNLRVKLRCISAYNLITTLPCFYPLHVILFLHLLSTNHKCTQPCYFPLLLKPTAQKILMENSLTRSSRLVLPRLLSCGVWSFPLICFVTVVIVFNGQYLCNKLHLIMKFGYPWTLFVRVCGINDPRRTCY